MSQEMQPQQATVAQTSVIASDASELTDAELALVVGGTEGPGGPTDGTSRSGA